MLDGMSQLIDSFMRTRADNTVYPDAVPEWRSTAQALQCVVYACFKQKVAGLS